MQIKRLNYNCRNCKSNRFKIWRRTMVAGLPVALCQCADCNYMNAVTSDRDFIESLKIELDREEESVVIYQKVTCPKCGGSVSTPKTRTDYLRNYVTREHVCKSCNEKFKSIDMG